MTESNYYWNQIRVLLHCIEMLHSVEANPEVIKRLEEEKVKYMSWYVDATGHIYDEKPPKLVQ